MDGRGKRRVERGEEKKKYTSECNNFRRYARVVHIRANLMPRVGKLCIKLRWCNEMSNTFCGKTCIIIRGNPPQAALCSGVRPLISSVAVVSAPCKTRTFLQHVRFTRQQELKPWREGLLQPQSGPSRLQGAKGETR